MNILLLPTMSLVAYRIFNLKDADFVVMDGFANGTESPTVAAGGASQGASVVPITDGTMEKAVPIGARVKFAGDTTRYEVTNRVLNATGTDEVQSMATSTATGGTFTLTITFPSSAVTPVSSVTTAAIAFDATAAAVESAIDAAMAAASIAIDGVTFTAGDITVAGGPVNAAATTFTFDGASVSKRNWPLITGDGTLLTGGTLGAITETTTGEKPNSTDSITITPVLAVALTGGEAITFSPIELVAKVGDGTVSYDESREVEHILDRGNLSEVRIGDDQPMEVSWAFVWEFLQAITGAPTPTIEDALKRRGAASTWTSTNPDECGPYSVDIEIRNIPECTTLDANEDTPELIRLPQFFYTNLGHDANAALVSVEGTCNVVEATSTRGNL